MKKLHAGIVSLHLVLSGVLVHGASESSILERGEHHRVIETRTIVVAPDGSQEIQTNRYTELATGMHVKRQDTGEWVEARQRITGLVDGAMVEGTGFPILFANNLNSPAPVTMWAGERRIKVRLVGLAYMDNTSAVWISTVKDSIGTIVGDEEVIFEDTMSDIPGVAVRYTVRGAGALEQDVILTQSALPDPAALNMDPASVRLCAISEFIDPAGAAVSATATDGVFVEQAISFGRAHVGRGKAFLIGNEEAGVPVMKSLQESEGHRYLIESIKLQAVEGQLQSLPQGAAVQADGKRIERMARTVVPRERLLASVAPAPDVVLATRS